MDSTCKDGHSDGFQWYRDTGIPLWQPVRPCGGLLDSGKSTGIESLANFELLRSHTNLIEQTADEIMGRKSVGDNVVTTLNVNLQQIASDALGKHRGAVIAIEPDTGRIFLYGFKAVL